MRTGEKKSIVDKVLRSWTTNWPQSDDDAHVLVEASGTQAATAGRKILAISFHLHPNPTSRQHGITTIDGAVGMGRL